MLILVALVVVIGVVVAVVTGAAGLGRALGLSRGAVAIAVVVLMVVVLLVVTPALFGFSGSGDQDTNGRAAAPPPAVRPSEATSGSRTEAAPADLPVVEMTANEPDEFAPDNVVGGLQPPGVVAVRAKGFGAVESGTVEQCVTELGRLPTCTPAFPVQFDEDGNAQFQFQVRDSFPVGACRWGRPTCVLRVRGSASGLLATAQTVFVDAPRRAEVILEPSTGVAEGDVVRVSVTGLPSGTTVVAVLCAPPSGYDPRRCGARDGAATFRVDAAGSGGSDLQVRTGPLGTEGRRCGPRVPCVVSVVTEEGFVAAPAVPLGLSRGPGASYEPGRLAAGLSVAAVLAAVAVVLARRTDWRKPTEAATPEVDGADLETDLTLDQLFGTDEEIDAADPVGL